MKKIRDFLKKVLITAICVIELLKTEWKNLHDKPLYGGKRRKHRYQPNLKSRLIIRILGKECQELRAEWKRNGLNKTLLAKLLEKEYKKICYRYGWDSLSDMPMTAPEWMCKFLPLTDDGGIIIAGIKHTFLDEHDLYAVYYYAPESEEVMETEDYRIAVWLNERNKSFGVTDLGSLANGDFFYCGEYYLTADREEARKCLAS